MMMVVQRATFSVMRVIVRRGWIVMILAARFGGLGANGGTADIGGEDAGIEPGQHAENHQPCEKRSH